jgi:hypothetical protein
MTALDSSGVSHWNSSTSSPTSPVRAIGQVLRRVELFPVSFVGEVLQCVLQFCDGHIHGISDVTTSRPLRGAASPTSCSIDARSRSETTTRPNRRRSPGWGCVLGVAWLCSEHRGGETLHRHWARAWPETRRGTPFWRSPTTLLQHQVGFTQDPATKDIRSQRHES